jgi:hypothetical protein
MLIVALMLPRVAMVLIWLLTDWFAHAYETWLLPLLGFIFLPYTTLAYMAAVLNAGGVNTLWAIIIVLAVIVDVGHWGHGYRSRPRRRVA